MNNFDAGVSEFNFTGFVIYLDLATPPFGFNSSSWSWVVTNLLILLWINVYDNLFVSINGEIYSFEVLKNNDDIICGL